MGFENLSLSAFTQTVKTNLKNNNVDKTIQQNIIDNIELFFNEANGLDFDADTLNEYEFNRASAKIDTKIAELKAQTQNMQKKPLGLGENEEKSNNSDIQNFISKFEGAKYRPHAKYNQVGQMNYKGEKVVIINHGDKYEVVRQHPIEQGTLEAAEYNSLDELYEAMSKEDYGWGRNTFRPDSSIGFNMRDLMFYDTGSKLVYRPFK